MTRILSLLLLLLGYGTSASAQQWLKVATEGPTQALSPTVSLPAGATYRFGLAACPDPNGGPSVPAWYTQGPVTISTQIIVYFPAGQLGSTDPCPGTPKEIDVLETPAPQIVTVTTGTSVQTLTIPGTQPPVLSTAPGTVYTLTFSGLTPQQVNLAISNTVGSVPLLCLPSYINSVLSLSCIVQAAGPVTGQN